MFALTKEQKKIGIGTVIAALVAAGIILWKHLKPKPPPPPPGMAQLQGIVIDAETGKPIANAEMYIDGTFELYTEPNGNFRTGYLAIGSHIITITSPFYQTGTFEVDLIEGLQRIDFALYKTPFTEGFEVHWAGINGKDHEIITLGETAIVMAQIGNLSPDPCTQIVCCYLNSESQCLNVTFAGGYQQPGWTAWPSFDFTPTAEGIYAVRLGNWSGTLEVKPIVIEEFYCPYCIRFERPLVMKLALKDGRVLESGTPIGSQYFPNEMFSAEDIAWIEWNPLDANVTEFRVGNWAGGTFVIPEIWEKDRSNHYHTNSKSFVWHLEGHIEVGASATGCPYCGLAFECRDSDLREVVAWRLYEHIKEQHLLQCYVCGKDLTFANEADWRGDSWTSHLTEHGITAPEIQVSPLYSIKSANIEFYNLEDYNVNTFSRSCPYCKRRSRFTKINNEWQCFWCKRTIDGSIPLQDPRDFDKRWRIASVLFSYFNATAGVVGQGWFIDYDYFWPWPCDPLPDESGLRLSKDYRVGAMKFKIPDLADKSWTCQIVQCGSKSDVSENGYRIAVRYSFTGSGDTVKIGEWALCRLRDTHIQNINFVLEYDSEVLVLANMYAYGDKWGVVKI